MRTPIFLVICVDEREVVWPSKNSTGYLEDVRDTLGLNELVWNLFLCDHNHTVLATDGDAGDASSLDCLECIFCRIQQQLHTETALLLVRRTNLVQTAFGREDGDGTIKGTTPARHGAQRCAMDVVE